jgi:glucosamine-6-phosphate deaminase
LKIIEVANYEEMSKEAAKIIVDKVKEKPNAVLGLATGGTPEGAYNYLIKNYQKSQLSYAKVHTVNLDEYIGLEKNHPQSYTYYMNEHLFKHINLPKEQTHFPSATSNTDQKDGEKYEQLIESLGGIDLQILGIGENGHIGFNEPGTSFSSKTSVVELTVSTRKANARYFNQMEEVPTHAISMGISTIMKSEEIILLVSGKKKAFILHRLLTEEISKELPASILKNHPNVTIIADQEALSIMKEKEGSVYS